ncbi:hypothetical protein ABEB36_009124 [Hypothenemus hampei]|uniref:Uncharacterized protein n=1 Tax=Hypothenemus hampei TaxID=57062 RepID=A0ABD1EP77_HYPHA
MQKPETGILVWDVLKNFDVQPDPENLKRFSVTIPVISNPMFSYSKKCYVSQYYRNSCNVEPKKHRAVLDFNEIALVADEVVVEPVNDRRISRDRFASETDLLVLDPLLLETMPRQRVKTSSTESEQNKMARITITYVLAFFALILITYFIIYLA